MSASSKTKVVIGTFIGTFIGVLIVAVISGWWTSWIAPHFGLNVGFWTWVGCYGLLLMIVPQDKYWWVTACLSLGTIAIWLGFATH